MSLATQIQSLATRVSTEFKTVKTKLSGNSSGDLSGLLTTAKTSLLAAINEVFSALAGKQNNLGYTPENSANKGQANGYAPLDASAKVPAANLPSYVDDVVEYANFAAFPGVGETGKIYLAIDTNATYRWSGSGYVQLKGDLALGETASSAYRGDRGAAAWNHSQINDGSNPHGTTFANLAAKPNTIAGFGINDAYNKTEIGDPATDFVATFEAGLL